MKKILMLLALLLFVVGCTQQTPGESQTPPKEEIQKEPEQEAAQPQVGNRVGDLAPDFELRTLDGKSIKLSDYRGKPVHLVFWSVDCVYCVQELPHVQEVYNNYKADYSVLALNITLQDGLDKAKAFIEEAGYDFPTVLIENTEQGLEALQNYQVRGIPLNVFIDSEGVIAYVKPGMMGEADQEKIIKELMNP